MGKVRVHTIGIEEAEEKQKEKAAKRKEAKKVIKESEAPSETKELQEKPIVKFGGGSKSEQKRKETKQQRKNGHVRSKKYQTNTKLVEKYKTYPLSEALELLSKIHLASFNETVELHINTHEKGISGIITLPHGTGKKTKIAILAPAKDAKAADDLLKEIEKGLISFDVLIATPDAMPRLAKVARILGPRGLMPNPKNGTITQKPEEAAQQYEKGQLTFKTESKAPVIHLSVGKLSFGKEKLMENITAAITAVQAKNIKNITLKSTMSPGIKAGF